MSGIAKVVSQLPSLLEPDTIYLVRSGVGYDQYVTNHSGLITAYPMNPAANPDRQYSPIVYAFSGSILVDQDTPQGWTDLNPKYYIDSKSFVAPVTGTIKLTYIENDLYFFQAGYQGHIGLAPKVVDSNGVAILGPSYDFRQGIFWTTLTTNSTGSFYFPSQIYFGKVVANETYTISRQYFMQSMPAGNIFLVGANSYSGKIIVEFNPNDIV